MKVDNLATDDATATELPVKPFNAVGLERLYALKEEFDDLEFTLGDIEKIGGAEAEGKANQLKRQLREFEPSITMIGQVKAGKTSLVNALAGQPGLLPADVNPWTSVVTSLHFNAPRPEGAPEASFQLFENDEWDRLVKGGGRIGELSQRAGADDEMSKVQAQIEKVQEKSRERLGRRFELLMGQTHDYEKLTDDLVQRYVCMGDDFDLADREAQKGWFADITKSADLYLSSAALPIPLCIRDTPGMNDTFMMREQITINALRESRTCVVVLSAHQALSTMDLALIRLIANVKSREIVIFVNRIDELSNPADDITAIRTSISRTLEKHGCPENIKIVFGSAYWANIALSGEFDTMVDDSAQALSSYAASRMPNRTFTIDAPTLWSASGVPDLLDALSERIVEGPGAETLNLARQRAKNQLGGLQAASNIVSLRMEGNAEQFVEQAQALAEMDELSAKARASINEKIEELTENFSARVDRSHDRFLERALEALLQYLESKGDGKVWQYSADGLRVLLRTSYNVMQRNFTTQCNGVFQQTAEDLTALYQRLFAVAVDNFTVEPPTVPALPAPVTLGQTIALDLQTSWWKGWWNKRKGHRNLASGYFDLIKAETAPIINDLKKHQCNDIRALATKALEDFLTEQRNILSGVSEKAQASEGDLHELFGITAQSDRQNMFGIIMNELSVGDAKE
ncbi:MAG: dynamin family protein [Litoreibacter sp.]